jgi:hypothetical protein
MIREMRMKRRRAERGVFKRVLPEIWEIEK